MEALRGIEIIDLMTIEIMWHVCKCAQRTRGRTHKWGQENYFHLIIARVCLFFLTNSTLPNDSNSRLLDHCCHTFVTSMNLN